MIIHMIIKQTIVKIIKDDEMKGGMTEGMTVNQRVVKSSVHGRLNPASKIYGAHLGGRCV